MRITRILATSLAILFTICTTLLAQSGPQAPGGQPPQGRPSGPAGPSGAGRPPAGTPPNLSHGVAVIDIGYIMDRYARVKQEQEAWKHDMESVGAGLKKEDEQIARSAEKLKGLKPGTPDFKKLEEELTQKSSDLKVKLQFQEKEFNDRRAADSAQGVSGNHGPGESVRRTQRHLAGAAI